MHTTTTTEEASPTVLIKKARRRAQYHLKGIPCLLDPSIRIGDYLFELGCKPHVCAAGYLSRTLGHKGLDSNHFTRLFGEQVLRIVEALQYEEDEASLDVESELDLLDRIEAVGADPLVIKIVEWIDFIRNLSREKTNSAVRRRIKMIAEQWLQRGENILGIAHQAIIDLKTTIDNAKVLA